jgi:hypothetical protein
MAVHAAAEDITRKKGGKNNIYKRIEPEKEEAFHIRHLAM